MVRVHEHVESELSLVGSLVLDPSTLEIVAPVVSPSDFSDPRAATLYRVVADALRDKLPLDAVTLKALLESRGLLESAGGVEMILAALDTPTAAHAPQYARAIRGASLRRSQLAAAKAASRSAEAGIVEGAFEELTATTKALADFEADCASGPKPIHALELLGMELPDAEYLIRPVVSLGNLTLLQGEPKSGKSVFSLLLAVAIASGRWNSGRWDPITTGPEMTLFITWEDGLRRVKRRVKEYLAGLQEPLNPPCSPTHLIIHAKDTAPRIRLDTSLGVSALAELVKTNGIKLLVLDTLSHLSGGDENSKAEMQPVMDALKDIAQQQHCAIIAIHHTGKPGKDPGQRSMVYRSRGSSVIAAAADVIIDWGDRKDTNSTPVSIISKDDDGDKFNVEYVPEKDEDGHTLAVRWKLVDAEPEVDGYGNRKMIVEALGKLIGTNPNGVSRGQIVKETSLPKSSVIRHLDALHREGSIQARKDAKAGWIYATISHHPFVDERPT